MTIASLGSTPMLLAANRKRSGARLPLLTIEELKILPPKKSMRAVLFRLKSIYSIDDDDAMQIGTSTALKRPAADKRAVTIENHKPFLKLTLKFIEPRKEIEACWRSIRRGFQNIHIDR